MSGSPRALVVGAGRIAGGYLAPLLAAAGWDITLACRNGVVRDAVNAAGGLGVRVATDSAVWIDGVHAVGLDKPALDWAARRADLIMTAVGPSSLGRVGRMLAPLVRRRLDATTAPLNIITFENHRRAPELLGAALIDEDASLAGEIGHRLGIGGAAVWRAVSTRTVEENGVWFHADELAECYVDRRSLVPGTPPLGGELPGITLVDSFEARIVEKLWVFNAGHAAAAYLGWHAGCDTMDQAMALDDIRQLVMEVVVDAQIGLETYLAATPGAPTIPRRSPDWILRRYADPALVDPVVRVGREPRRKLSPGDRLIGPAIAAMASGHTPGAIAIAIAAALAYHPEGDRQASDLQFELALLGPEEVLATLSGLDPTDELTRLIADRYRADALLRVAQ